MSHTRMEKEPQVKIFGTLGLNLIIYEWKMEEDKSWDYKSKIKINWSIIDNSNYNLIYL